MSPVARTITDSPNAAIRYSVFGCEVPMRFGGMANRCYLGTGKLGPGMEFARAVYSMLAVHVSHILCVVRKEQVGGIAAWRVVASMAHKIFVGSRRTIQKCPRNAMRSTCPNAAQVCNAVSFGVPRCHPRPTLIRFPDLYPGPKPLGQFVNSASVLHGANSCCVTT